MEEWHIVSVQRTLAVPVPTILPSPFLVLCGFETALGRLACCCPLNELCLTAELGVSSDTSLPLRLTADSNDGYHTQFCPDFDSFPADRISPQGCTVSPASCSGTSLTLSAPPRNLPGTPTWAIQKCSPGKCTGSPVTNGGTGPVDACK